MSLESFINGYITTALWTDEEQLGEEYFESHGVEPLGTGSRYKPEKSDLSPETLEQMRQDCTKFYHENLGLIEDDDLKRTPDYDLYFSAGHDFWLTRNGHGAGFWDGDWPKHGDTLTEKCKAFGECNLYVGDDGLIYHTS